MLNVNWYELVGDVPADGLNDEQTVKVAACEERWRVRGKLHHAADYQHNSPFAPEPHKGRKWEQRTPAMAAGLTDHIWSIEELLEFHD